MLSRRRMPSLQELIAFEAVARSGSFTHAAKELSLSQSAISKQVKQLERALGAPLIDRTGSGLRRTEAGEVFLRAAREMLGQFHTASVAIGGGSEGSEALSLIVLPTFAEGWLVERLPSFLKDRDDLTLHITTRVQPYDFLGTSHDIAITYGAAGWTHPEATLLFEERFIPVASADYLARLGVQGERALARATLLQQLSRPTLWRDYIDETGIIVEDPFSGPTVDRFPMAIQAAGVGLGIALVPDFLVHAEIAKGTLCKVSNRSLAGAGAYHLVLPRTKQSPVTNQFKAWIMVEAHSGSGPAAR